MNQRKSAHPQGWASRVSAEELSHIQNCRRKKKEGTGENGGVTARNWPKGEEGTCITALHESYSRELLELDKNRGWMTLELKAA